MSTVDKIMALADEYAEGFLAAPTFAVAQMRASLRAAIAEALDMGEPVAYTTARTGYTSGAWRSTKEGPFVHPLYAAKDAK